MEDEESDTRDQDDEETVRRKIDDKERQDRLEVNKKCRPRIDILATPNRRLLLALYQNHSDHLPREKVEKIKVLLQELYAMTAEETERYFAELKYDMDRRERKKRIKYLMKKEYAEIKKREEIYKAYKFIEKILRRGMFYAFYNSIPAMVSVRLRNLSDIILEQICDLLNVDIPLRNESSKDKVGIFLITIADWTAIFLEHIYYRVQLKKNEELEELEREKHEMEKNAPIKSEPVMTDTHITEGGEGSIYEDEFGIE